MENLLFSVNVVGPLFFLMALGYICRQIRFVSDAFLTETNRFVFKLSLPLMLFENIRSAIGGDFSDPRLVAVAVLGILAVIAISTLIILPLVKRPGQRGAMIQGIYRSNFLIYGFPLVTKMFGEEALGPLSLLLAVSIPLFNVAAVIILTIFSEKQSQKPKNRRDTFKLLGLSIIRNPLIIGCAAGTLFGLLHIELPVILGQPLQELSHIATPLGLFVMGGEFRFKSLHHNLLKVVCASVARLIIVPLIAMIICVNMGFRGAELSVLLCLFGTPSAVAGFVMADSMGCDGRLAGQIVVLTTTCSCITIFLFILVMKNLGYL